MNARAASLCLHAWKKENMLFQVRDPKYATIIFIILLLLSNQKQFYWIADYLVFKMV